MRRAFLRASKAHVRSGFFLVSLLALVLIQVFRFSGLTPASGEDGFSPATFPPLTFLPSWTFSGVGDPVAQTPTLPSGSPASPNTTDSMLSSGIAHAGNRIFLEPLIVKDGDIDNQLTLMPAYGGMPGHSSAFTTPIMLEKRLTHHFSVRLDTHYIDLWTPNKGYEGFQYLGLQGKLLLYENDPHEIFTTFILRGITPVGGSPVGQGNPFTLYSYLVFNKGLGDVPVSWIRPFAFQTDVAGIVPFGDGPMPLSDFMGTYDYGDFFRFDGAIEYSFLYLHDILGVPMPSFFAHLTPAVESRTLVNLSNNGYYGLTEGYLSYEVNYQADWYQVSVAYQQPYGADSSFLGQRYVLYTTFFYGWLLRKMGYHATPY
ncbi:MAG: hypothetical protein C75L2_00050005 [Leptospirillum sp. Group II 'C75']|jgi:hypothetical protein|uniref:hypothetical protein n=1 Tax=Leptospirillum sp. Group II 'CF-1' TaxID=1660083 RepID=UPI00029CAD53|nr:hypothetical protein [Leptospirillum sp. Group II 'CF-1']AKS22707.1 hypothetical protein ABH19_01490 [Leptospirillum sp. Group II 'CF-1']EIJ75403.1 MAG: hypothetical protein C75L2_00050005 [Leptospirillum sp. Group II 'C75']